jgi:hypothetical protein
LVPKIVIDRLVVTPYVTGDIVTLVIVGCGATTVNPFDRLALNPPAAVGFVTVTVYAPGASAVFGHQNLTWPLVVST